MAKGSSSTVQLVHRAVPHSAQAGLVATNIGPELQLQQYQAGSPMMIVVDVLFKVKDIEILLESSVVVSA